MTVTGPAGLPWWLHWSREATVGSLSLQLCPCTHMGHPESPGVGLVPQQSPVVGSDMSEMV